jgi:hypothetical protein
MRLKINEIGYVIFRLTINNFGRKLDRMIVTNLSNNSTQAGIR